jgi:hypothetical protein
MTARPDLPTPTYAQIERAWAGKPIDGPDLDDDSPGPERSNAEGLVDLALLALTPLLFLFGLVGLIVSLEPRLAFAAVGAGCWTGVAVALRTHRMLAVSPIRSRLIARREREPFLYWSSVVAAAGWGALVLSMVFFLPASVSGG